MYHRLTEFRDYSVSWNDSRYFLPHLGLSVSVERFEEQMRYVRENMTPVPLEKLNTVWSQKRPKKPYCLVTFDDGYLDNLELALPIVEKYQIPITVFVTSGFIDRSVTPWWIAIEEVLRVSDQISLHLFDNETMILRTPKEKLSAFFRFNERFRHLSVSVQREALDDFVDEALRTKIGELFLTENQLRTLASHPLVTVGGHTAHHAVLSQESDEDVALEISHGLDRLEEILGIRPKTFAYPFGDRQACGVREVDICSHTGVEFAFGTRIGNIFPQHRLYQFILPRQKIDFFDDISTFVSKLTGVDSCLRNPLNRFVTL